MWQPLVVVAKVARKLLLSVLFAKNDKGGKVEVRIEVRKKFKFKPLNTKA